MRGGKDEEMGACKRRWKLSRRLKSYALCLYVFFSPLTPHTMRSKIISNLIGGGHKNNLRQYESIFSSIQIGTTHFFFFFQMPSGSVAVWRWSDGVTYCRLSRFYVGYLILMGVINIFLIIFVECSPSLSLFVCLSL